MANLPPPLPPSAFGSPQPLSYHAPSAYGYMVRCPRCGDPRSKKATFTWWGGLLGPKLFSHVVCLSCGNGYNGKTGQPNTTRIAIYVGVSVAIGLVIAGVALAGLVFYAG